MLEKKLTVLIIEDEQVYRTLASQVFEGCEKIFAVTASEGFLKYKEQCPDITLLDIGLPDRNGLDLLPEIISYDPEAFIVMLTISRVSSDVKMSRERGAAGYILKPFSHQKVSQCVGKYKEYKKRLQSMTPEERAGKLIEKLKIESLHDDLNQQVEEKITTKSELSNLNKIDETLKSWQILFADSILINRERAAIQLIKLGCRVDLAEDSSDALKKVEEKTYNLMLIDSKIGGIGGYEVAKEIRKKERAAGIEKSTLIIMVEDTGELDRHLWQKADMNDFVKKPASFSKLREMVIKHVKNTVDHNSEEYVN